VSRKTSTEEARSTCCTLDSTDCAAASDLSATRDQRLIVTGASGGDSTQGTGIAGIVGLSPNGALDPAYGSGGYFRKRFVRSPSGIYALVVDATGSTFATGYVLSDECWRGYGHKTYTCRALALMRLKANGQLKEDFGHVGLVTSPRLCRPNFPPCGKAR
jgi:hypothetical protein